ncbi:hypothetical protein [Chitinophaga eiseniae]|uniref:hypothetical protein n=1 Tax=Chitinophaga eiseniae TaxID=634771 RepID=UPI00099A98AA|nr:hypothetical protein [Chitinophaga eiseniae]
MNKSTGHCLYQITRITCVSQLFVFLLYACNQGPSGHMAADSAIATGKTDTVVTMVPAPGQLSVELTGITEAAFRRHQPPASSQVDFDTTSC